MPKVTVIIVDNGGGQVVAAGVVVMWLSLLSISFGHQYRWWGLSNER